MSGVTAPYTRTREAFALVAHELGVSSNDVRVLVAIYEAREGGTRTHALAAALGGGADYTMLRRSVLVLYDRGLAVGEPRKPGVQTTLSLTDAGRFAARKAFDRANELPVRRAVAA